MFLDFPKPVETVLFALLVIVLAITVTQHLIAQAWADANDGGAAYRSNTGTNGLNSPKYREWTGSTTSWSAEVELPSVGHNVRSAMILFSPISSERVILSYDTNGDIDLFRCSGTCTTASNWQTIGTVATTQSYGTTNPYRPFCAAYEEQSGKLVIAYDKGLNEAADFYSKTWKFGDGLSTEASIDYIGSGSDSEEVRFCRIAPKVGSNEVALALIDASNTDSYAFIWNATAAAFGNRGTITTATGTMSIGGEAIGVAYERASGAAVAFSGDANNSACWIRWAGSWGSPNCNDPNSNADNRVRFVSMKPDPVPTSNKIMICQGDSLQDLTCAQEDNNSLGAWSAASNLTTSLGTTTARPFDFAWNPSGSTGAIFYETSNTADLTVTSNTWSGSAWGIGLPLVVSNAVHRWFVSTTNPTDSDTTINIMWLKLNSIFDVGAIRYDGILSTLMGESTHTADTTVVTFADESTLDWQKSTATPVATKTPLEGLGLSDANPKNPGKQLSENIGASDALQAIKNLFQNLNESLSLSDNRTFNAGRRIDENAGLSDAPAFASLKSISENLDAADAVAPAAMFSSLLNESLAAADEISDISLDLQFTLTESLAMVISFFTPQVAYQSTLVSEDITVSDSLEIGTQYDVVLNESISVNETATAQEHVGEDPTGDDERAGGSGRGSTDHVTLISEPISVPPNADLQNEFVANEHALALTETFGLTDEPSATVSAHNQLAIEILETSVDTSTAFRLIPPAAVSSVEFRIVNNGNTSEHVVLKYWCTDERGSRTCEGTQELEIESNGSESRTVLIPFLQPGTYHVEAGVGTQGEEVKGTASLEISVPWTTVYLYPALIAIIAIIASAAALVRVEMNKRASKSGGRIL